MALYLALKPDGTSIVSDSNPIATRHDSEGLPQEVSVFMFNDGKRKNVPNDVNPPELIYTNIEIQLEGVSTNLKNGLTNQTSDFTVSLDDATKFNIGTILKVDAERMRVEEVLSATSVRVTRNYIADGKASTQASHSTGAVVTAETGSVALALPNPADPTYNTVGTYEQFGASLSKGVNPSLLILGIDAQEATNLIKSNNGAKYSINSLIKIDNEIMKVTGISGNDISVLRGYGGTTRETHNANAVIYLVGVVDKAPTTFKFWVKNDPPAGLPTQKKRDVKVVIKADEEPL